MTRAQARMSLGMSIVLLFGSRGLAAVSPAAQTAAEPGPGVTAPAVAGAQASTGRQGQRRPPRVHWVPGEIYPTPDSEPPRPAALRTPRNGLQAAPRLVLEVLSESARPRMSQLDAPARPRQIGVHRRVSASGAARVAPRALRWAPTPEGGAAGSLVVVSPGAAAVRLAIEFTGLPAGAEVRFVDASVAGPVVGPLPADFLTPPPILDVVPPGKGIDGGPDRMDPGEPFWSPVVDGDAIAMEIWVPEPRRSHEVEYRVLEVAHLFESPLSLHPVSEEAPCTLHTACRERLTPLVNAVAWQVFEQDGRSYGCTGQLLADTDPDTSKLYYATAAHCISIAEAARSGTFLWFFQRQDCAGLHLTERVQTSGGGRLLATTGSPWQARRSPDFTLLRLRRPPPDGVAFSGWTNTPSEDLVGSRVDSISHPRGTTKRMASGLIDFEIQKRFVVPGHLTSLFEPPYTHYGIHLDLGSIDGGSSGSGVWIGRRWPEQYLVGVLTSGSDSCPGPQSFAFAGSFDLAYRHVREWLAPRARR